MKKLKNILNSAIGERCISAGRHVLINAVDLLATCLFAFIALWALRLAHACWWGLHPSSLHEVEGTAFFSLLEDVVWTPATVVCTIAVLTRLGRRVGQTGSRTDELRYVLGSQAVRLLKLVRLRRVRVNVFLNMNPTAMVHGYCADDDMYLDHTLSLGAWSGVEEALKLTYQLWQSATHPHLPKSRSIHIGDVIEVREARRSRYFAVALNGYHEVDAPRWFGAPTSVEMMEGVDGRFSWGEGPDDIAAPPTHHGTTAQGYLTKEMRKLLDKRCGSLTEDFLWERYEPSASCDICDAWDVPCVESGEFGEEMGLCIDCCPPGHAARAISKSKGPRKLFRGRS